MLRHHVENDFALKPEDGSPVMAWMVRWAVDMLSRYTNGEDGRTPFERLRHESCVVAVVPFGDIVMYLQLKIARGNKGYPAKKIGAWLGAIERTEEVLIGTERGDIKRRTVTHLPEGEQWDAQIVNKARGLPWEPLPGRQSHHAPVAINEEGALMDGETEATKQKIKLHDEDDAGERKYTNNPVTCMYREKLLPNMEQWRDVRGATRLQEGDIYLAGWGATIRQNAEPE